MQFASDNTAPVPEEIMAALIRANAGHAPSYGADTDMARVRDALREMFEAPGAAVYLVATGTAANALALAVCCPPWAAIYCHRTAHIAVDECGAPEFYTGGARLALIDGPDGKIAADALAAAVAATGHGNPHQIQRGMVSLTSITESGTIYTLDDLHAVSAIARANGLPVHMDGARFANALVTLGCTPAEMTWKAGVDVLSFGATKNGCLGVEAVIFFDPAHAWEFELRRKRAGHLVSKHRYLSAQMAAYLDDGLWLRLARAANDAAARLAAGIAALPQAGLLHPVAGNMIFARFPQPVHDRLRAAGAVYYDWPDHLMPADAQGTGPAARLVCNWSTGADEVDAFLAHAAG